MSGAGDTRSFPDHFSGVAESYSAYRPEYPEELFDWITAKAPDTCRAWDCATGSGQAAGGLASRFRSVIATDGSVDQLAAARRVSGVRYVAAMAERSPWRVASVDVVTVGQALHWLDLEAFFAQVRRVLRPGGLVVAWMYSLFETRRDVQTIVERLYDDLRASWPPERRHVENGYRDLKLPFESLDAPCVEMTRRWSLQGLLGYLSSWSAVARRRREVGAPDPLAGPRTELRRAWGDPDRSLEFSWKLTVLAGRVPSEL